MAFISLQLLLKKRAKQLGLEPYIKNEAVIQQTKKFLLNLELEQQVKVKLFKQNTLYLECINSIIANEIKYLEKDLKQFLAQIYPQKNLRIVITTSSKMNIIKENQ